MLRPTTLLLLTLAATTLARPGDLNKVNLPLEQKLSKGQTANIFLTFTKGTSEVLKAVSTTRFESRANRLTSLHSRLVANAKRSQVNARSLLSLSGTSFETLWVTNQIYVRNADIRLVEKLAKLAEVSEITEEVIISLDDPISHSPITKRNSRLAEWGITKIQAEEAITLLKNCSTSLAGIRIATIDTGVRVTHEALRDNFYGTYGWFDPYEKTPIPNDNNGHGTHTTGTICGKGGIGVYPDAKWMACKGCATSSCAQYALIECGQYLVCPTLPDGSSPDCTKAPHLVSNSWGGGRGANWFDGIIAAWHAAGIIPFFSIGNSGPRCGTANSPGDRNVIGVGSTTISDNLSSFSSVGPTIDGTLKPEISAPGENVVSSYHTADDAYRSLSGTSMASPHAAGAAAILMAYAPNLKYEDVQDMLLVGADRDLPSADKECEGVKDSEFPNHHFGHGRLNAYNALLRATQAKTVVQ